MKPIILVVMGAAMLMPMMHHHNAPDTALAHKRKIRHIQHLEIKKDTETRVPDANLRINYIP